MTGLTMEIKQERRLCTVNGITGYFHTWEHYSKPLPASPLIGGEPAGVFSKIFGIVEFEDGVKRIDPTDIKFCDEENAMLSWFNKHPNIPDCNDCGYLNHTEEEQQAYGANSYKKDHRCKCYEMPVYHRANSRNHNSYIYPCEECRKDNFVNYYDCESSKCNKKGE